MPKSIDDYANELEGNPRGFLIKGFVALVILAVAIGALGWVFNWFGKGADIIGPQNVEEQYTQVIQDWESLKTAAENACAASSGPREKGDPVMVEDPAFAYGATYRRIVVDYNRRQKNIWEAGLVGPAGYPKEVGDGHLKLSLMQDGHRMSAIGFRMADRLQDMDITRAPIDVVFHLQENHYRGNVELQLKLIDFRLSA